MRIDIERIFKKSVGENSDFHFYLDELTGNDCMPTYLGEADEKYTFDEMNDEFFRFIERKIAGEGIYIRLIHATGQITPTGAKFLLEFGMEKRTFETSSDNVRVFDFADYGIKIRKDTVTFGTSVFECNKTPHFAGFESYKGDDTYLSLKNPLNQLVISIMKEFIDCEV